MTDFKFTPEDFLGEDELRGRVFLCNKIALLANAKLEERLAGDKVTEPQQEDNTFSIQRDEKL